MRSGKRPQREAIDVSLSFLREYAEPHRAQCVGFAFNSQSNTLFHSLHVYVLSADRPVDS
jgi:hypothetical protein